MLNDKEIPRNPPIFHDNKFVADFRKNRISLILFFFFLQNSAQLLKIIVTS